MLQTRTQLTFARGLINFLCVSVPQCFKKDVRTQLLSLNQWTYWKDWTEKTALQDELLVGPSWVRSSMAEQAPLKR